MVVLTAFSLSVIVVGAIFIGLILWLWNKKDVTLQKKGYITLFLLAGLAGVIYASFAFTLISTDNASYYSEGRNLGTIDYNQMISNARQTGYIVEGPMYIDSDLFEASGIWSPGVSQVRAYLGDSFWVSSLNYYFPEGTTIEVRFENGTTILNLYNETWQDQSFSQFETKHLPGNEVMVERIRVIFGVNDAAAQTYLGLLKRNIENEDSTTATLIVTHPPDFNSTYTDMKNMSDTFIFTETTGTGSIRQVFYEDNRIIGSIGYILQNSKIIHQQSGNDYIMQADTRGGVNLQVRLAAGTEIPEEEYKSVFRKMFSDLGLDPEEVDHFDFAYSPSSW
jgi:hypothetical protein